jgi:hypothetical protein
LQHPSRLAPLIDKGDYESAGSHAQTAYDGGYSLQGLRKKLKKVNGSMN